MNVCQLGSNFVNAKGINTKALRGSQGFTG
jgi:hypothetical protein